MMLADVRDPVSLCGTLSQILFFIEHVNATCREEVFDANKGGQTPQLQNVLINQANSFYFRRERWHRKSDLLRLMDAAGIQPAIDRDIIGALIQRMLSPAHLYLSGDRWSVRSGSSRLREPVFGVSRRRETIYVCSTRYGYDYAAVDPSPREVPVATLKKVPSLYFDEPLNPIDVAKDFLVGVLGVPRDSANHYIQHWIRLEFGLKYNKAIKYSLSYLCRSLNLLFFGSHAPTQRHQQSTHAKAVSVRYLIDQIQSMLSPDAGLRGALGIYWLLRFCRNLRPRVHWIFDEPRSLKATVPTLTDSQREDAIKAAVVPRQCVTALRPLQYTYFQTRAFGAISGIRGLNTIFRGGLLPHTNRGRTFLVRGQAGSGKTALTLQLMADMARRGRCAVYISLEESYEAIVDRLVTFGLVDEEYYSIRQAAGDPAPIIAKALEEKPRKGLLLLYGNNEKIDLIAAINDLREALGDHWRWRGLAIDSANALESDSTAPQSRATLRTLVEAIEENLFWGLIIAEKDKATSDLADLAYLSDTVVDLSVDEERQSREIEISKCRTQHFHPGVHPFRIIDQKGIQIYPSLASMQSTMRRRAKATLSEERKISLPVEFGGLVSRGGVEEKSSTLIWGPAGTGKTILLLQLLTQGTRKIPSDQENAQLHADAPPESFLADRPPGYSLFITFRTSESKFGQILRRHRDLSRRWSQSSMEDLCQLRCYTPGSNLGGAQIVAELTELIEQHRISRTPIERIVFYEIDAAEEVLPLLHRESLFWPTIFELVGTEALTSFFVVGADSSEDRLVKILRSGVDYSFHLSTDSGTHQIEADKQPSFSGSASIGTIPFGISEGGEVRSAKRKDDLSEPSNLNAS